MLFFYHSCYFSLFMLIFYDVEVKKSFDLSDIERKGMTDRIPPSRLWKGQDFMLRLLLFGRQVYLKYSMDEMSVYAAQASFFIIMAAFPFFMVLLALIQVAPMIHEADLLRFLLPAIPGRFQGLLIYLLDSLHSDSPAALISVTALAAVWSAAKGMLGIEKGLNRVFGVTSPRNYILRRALCSVYTLAFSLMCVTSLALLVFGSFLQEMLLKWLPALSYLSGMISLGRGLVMFIMLMIFFTAIYTALPHRRLSICGQIPGAMFSAAGWALTSLAFSVYFRYFGTYAVTYGSLTAVILFMLWLYVSICILFVGAERGLEKDLIPKAGYEFRTVHISSFHRSLKPAEIKHNLVSLYNMVRSPAEARAILKEFRPDAVIGTGGYASYPTVKAAAKMGIPTAVHESNAVPGLTTELLEPYAGRIMVGFESCRQHYKHPEKVAVTGTPVREDFFTLTKEAAKEKLGVNDGRPLIVSFWGSLGASGMNAQMADMLALEAGKEPFHHIHGAGKSGYAAVLKALAEKGVDLKDHPSLQVREYIYDMAPVMRAADLVICRAGASTVSELTALGVPAIMVPSPYVTNNHQEKNARALETHGGVEVLLEQDSSGQALFQTAAGILRDDARREAMASAMAELGIRDAAQRIYETVQELL